MGLTAEIPRYSNVGSGRLILRAITILLIFWLIFYALWDTFALSEKTPLASRLYDGCGPEFPSRYFALLSSQMEAVKELMHLRCLNASH